MEVSKEYEEYILDQLQASGNVNARRMFGGVGIYLDGVFCALISGGGQFYLKVNDANRPDFEAEGMKPFRPDGKHDMSYYEVPAHVLESRDELRRWALKAREVALDEACKRKRSRTRRKSGRALTGRST